MTFTLRRGSAPLLVSLPHVGTEIPAGLQPHYQPRALQVEDTDWHLAQLYDFAERLGASVLQPRISRYVIDLNRPPDDQPMYPGAANTELCPTRFFTGDRLYLEGQAPGPEERARRRALYWQPYHDALRGELERLRAEHGFVLLWDAHSIRGEIPWLFEGVLPDLNIGTADGRSAAPAVTEAVAAAAAGDSGSLAVGAPARRLGSAGPQQRYTHVVNGRFKGGYITRHYGDPAHQVHAVQLEMVQQTYMREEPPFDCVPERAREVQPVLEAMVSAALDAARALHGR